MKRLRNWALFAKLNDLGMLSPESFSDAFYWMILTIIGGLLPLWGGFIVLKLLDQSPSIITFAESGEFVVFGAGILSSAIYKITREITPNLLTVFKKKEEPYKISGLLKLTFPFHRPLNIIILPLILIAALTFSVVTLVNIPGIDVPLNRVFLRNLSLGVFIGSMLIGFFVSLFSNAWVSQTNLYASREQVYSKLEEEFDTMQVGE